MKPVIRFSGTLLLIGFLPILGGCAGSSARWGRALEPAIGTPFADFTYLDAEGRPQTLAEQLGDFTVLVFTKCRSNLHRSVAKPLTDLVQASQDSGIVKTVGLDIHWSETGCTQGPRCHLLSTGRNLYSICDGKGVVRTLYGADARNQVFVIGPDHHIADKGSLADWDALRSRFEAKVQAYKQRRHAELPQEF